MDEIRVSYLPMWERYLENFEEFRLTSSQIGELVMHMMKYQFRDEMPSDLDPILNVVWGFIREDLKRAKHQYITAVKNGKKGGRPRKTSVEKTEENPEKPRTRTKTRTRTESTTRSETRERTKTAASTAADLSVCEKAYGEFGWVKLTDSQHAQLEQMMGAWDLSRCIAYVDRAAQTTNNRNHWEDWAVVLRRCYEERWHDTVSRNAPIPTGASGHLGEAEMEAIRALLAGK